MPSQPTDRRDAWTAASDESDAPGYRPALALWCSDLRTHGYSRKGRAAQLGLKRRRREEEKLRATRQRNRKPRGLKDKSIRNIRTTLSTILSSAVKWGYPLFERLEPIPEEQPRRLDFTQALLR